VAQPASAATPTRLDPELVERVGGHQRNHALRTGAQLHDPGKPVAFHPHDHAREAVPRRLARDALELEGGRGFREEPRQVGTGDDPMATGAPGRRQAPVVGPSTHRIDAHAEHVGNLTRPIFPHLRGEYLK